MKHEVLALAVAVTWTGLASGQSMNVDFDMSNEEPEICFLPSNAYAAAGNAGHWNSVNNFLGEMILPPGGLRDLDGNPTVVIVDYDGLTAAICNAGGPIGDPDERGLLGDAWWLGLGGKPLPELTFSFTNLQNGTYEVITYAINDNDPATQTIIDVIGAPEGPQAVGGPWGGAPELGVTHAVHTVEVTTGEITIPTDRVDDVGATEHFLNGFQLRLVPPCPADLDGSGDVGIGDFLILLGAWGEAGGDVTGDGTTDILDFLALLADWGPCF